MIAIVISVISFLIMVIVTVILVNQSIDSESKRKSDMRRVVDQVNDVNTTAANVVKKQNDTLTDINTSIYDLKRDMTSLKDTAASKSDLAAEVKSSSGSFDKVKIGGSTVTTDSNNVYFSTGSDKIIGFDNANSSKRMLIGSSLHILESGKSNMFTKFDASGDAFIMTASNNRRLFLQNGAGPGVVIKNNQVGIGMDPKFGSFDVAGNLAIVGDSLMMGASNPRPALFGAADALTLNKGAGFSKGVTVESDMTVNGTLTARNWKAAGSPADDAGVVLNNSSMGIGVQPTGAHKLEVAGNMNMRNGGSFMISASNVMSLSNQILTMNSSGINSVVIGGRNVNIGSLDMSASNNITNMFYGSGLRFASAKKTPQSWDAVFTDGQLYTSMLATSNLETENAFTSRTIYPNQADRHWTTYHNNANKFVFIPEQVSMPSSTGNDEGVVSFTANGDVAAKGAGTFSGTLSADGNITSQGDLVAQKLCVRNSGVNTCLTKSHLDFLIQQFGAAKTTA